MSLLAESLVEEWLNRAGYFTIRGARFGVSATDLLAVRLGSSGLEARHIEVQVRTNAISYILSLTDEQAKRFGKKKTTDGAGRMMYYTTPSMLGSRRSFTPQARPVRGTSPGAAETGSESHNA